MFLTEHKTPSEWLHSYTEKKISVPVYEKLHKKLKLKKKKNPELLHKAELGIKEINLLNSTAC